MSDIRFNRWLHQSGTGGVSQDSSGRVGIGSSVPRTTLDVVGVVSATSFNATGVSTFSNGITVGTGASISSPATNILTLGTNNVERVRIDSNGLVGIGTTNPTVALQLSPDAVISNVNINNPLSSVAGAALTVAQFAYTNANGSYLRIKATRLSNGSSWTTASTKIVQVTDVTEQAYIEFNPSGGGYGMAFGGYNDTNGLTEERLRIDSRGRVTKPLQPVSCVYGNAGGSVNTGSESTWVIVKFANSTVNRGSAYSSSTGLYTCPVAGVYFVSAFFLTRANAAHNITIYKNGAGIGPTGRDITPSGEQNTGVMAYVNCAANDTLGIYFSNGSGGDFYVDYNYALFSLFG